MIASRRELLRTAIASTICRGAERPANANNPIEIVAENHTLAAESASGYRKLVASTAISAKVLILPAVRTLTIGRAHSLRRLAQNGYWILLECGLAFARPDEYLRQAAILECIFGILLDRQSEQTQWHGEYVEYEWPVHQLVRPFGTPTFLHCSHGATVGCWNGRAVSKLFHIGSGGIVFLGSALGIGLNSGEIQASTVVKALIYTLQDGRTSIGRHC